MYPIADGRKLDKEELFSKEICYPNIVILSLAA